MKRSCTLFFFSFCLYVLSTRSLRLHFESVAAAHNALYSHIFNLFPLAVTTLDIIAKFMCTIVSSVEASWVQCANVCSECTCTQHIYFPTWKKSKATWRCFINHTLCTQWTRSMNIKDISWSSKEMKCGASWGRKSWKFVAETKKFPYNNLISFCVV